MKSESLLDYDINRWAVRRAHPGETYAVYLAYAETHHGHGIVKVGATVEPYRRLYEVYSGCPFPIITFVWAWVGIKQYAFQEETVIKSRLAAGGHHLRGEWFKCDFPPVDGVDSSRLEVIRHRLKTEIYEKPLDWKDGDITEVLALAAIKNKAKPKAPKRKPWRG